MAVLKSHVSFESEIFVAMHRKQIRIKKAHSISYEVGFILILYCLIQFIV